MRKFSILLMVLCIVFIFSQLNVEARTYTIISNNWAGQEPFYVAEEKGFFKDEGIDIKAHFFSVIPDWFRATKSERFDFAVIYAENCFDFFLNNITKQKMIINLFSDVGEITTIVGRKGLTAEKVKGTTVGFSADVMCFKIPLFNYLQSIGLKMTDVKITTMAGDDLVQNFIYGRLDIITAFANNIPKVKEANGVVLQSTAKSNCAVGGYMVPVSKYKDIPKEDIKRFLRALIKTVNWMHDPKNDSEYRAIITKWMSENPDLKSFYSSREKLMEYRKLFKFFTPEEMLDANTTKMRNLFEKTKQINKQLGNPHELKYEDVVDIGPLKEVLQELDYQSVHGN